MRQAPGWLSRRWIGCPARIEQQGARRSCSRRSRRQRWTFVLFTASRPTLVVRFMHTCTAGLGRAGRANQRRACHNVGSTQVLVVWSPSTLDYPRTVHSRRARTLGHFASPSRDFLRGRRLHARPQASGCALASSLATAPVSTTATGRSLAAGLSARQPLVRRPGIHRPPPWRHRAAELAFSSRISPGCLIRTSAVQQEAVDAPRSAEAGALPSLAVKRNMSPGTFP